MAKHVHRRQVWSWRRLYVLGSGCLTVLFLIVLSLATCRPAWYAPRAIDHAHLEADKREFVTLVDEIGAALNAGKPIRITLDEDQLNRWLVARGEIWPGWEVEFEGLEGLQIGLLSGDRVRLAAQARNAYVPVILSAVARCELAGNKLRVHLETVRTGRLPIPHRKVIEPLEEGLGDALDGRIGFRGDTIELDNEWVWKNGRRRFRIAELVIRDGTAEVLLEPLPR